MVHLLLYVRNNLQKKPGVSLLMYFFLRQTHSSTAEKENISASMHIDALEMSNLRGRCSGLDENCQRNTFFRAVKPILCVQLNRYYGKHGELKSLSR